MFGILICRSDAGNECMTRVARGQANPSIASTSKRILKMHGTSLTLVQISEEQQRLLEQQQQQQLSRAKC